MSKGLPRPVSTEEINLYQETWQWPGTDPQEEKEDKGEGEGKRRRSSLLGGLVGTPCCH
jgi:hypothetical protein